MISGVFPQTPDGKRATSWIGVQRGLDPDDWRPMPSIDAGVREIRVREAAGAFRVIYVATFADVVYVLHAFHKKTRQTAKRDVDLAASRLREQIARMR
jgi:phage-related protein